MAPINPTFVSSSLLDVSTVAPPAVTVNQDTAAAPQNEIGIAVDPKNPNCVVAAANDYVPRAWECLIDGTTCSASGDAYSDTYYSNDDGQTFSDPQNISRNVLYDQGSRPIVGYDDAVYVIFEGATSLSTFERTYIVKSTDGGATFGKPVPIAQLQDIIRIANTVFRVNSFPAGAAAPNGDLNVA